MNSEQIAELARLRLSRVFGVPAEEVKESARFDSELKATFVSEFRRNEYDRVDDDIRDVADLALLKELESGVLTIQTVGDYCEHMIRCYGRNPKEVERVLHQ